MLSRGWESFLPIADRAIFIKKAQNKTKPVSTDGVQVEQETE